MSPQAYLNTYNGQSLLYLPRPDRESLRGQCVQAVCFFVHANNRTVIWADAYNWWTNRVADYDYIANSATAVPQPGDIIIWGPTLPNSGGAGHIAVCLYPLPGTGTFVSVDQNWGGKFVHQVTHNYNYVVGWLRIRGVNAAPAPAPQPQGAEEMISNQDQAAKVYKMLRPNGAASQAEINGTVGKRSFAQFVNDAQPEIIARDANLLQQNQSLANMSGTINAQNQTITDLSTKLQSASASGEEKQKALDEALAKIASQNADITTAHDELKDLQTALPQAPLTEPEKPKSSFLTRAILFALKFKKKK
jgi:hypothetical protein